MNAQEILRTLLETARNVGPLVEAVTGTALLGPAINAAEAVIRLIDEASGTFSATDQAQLQQMRDELEARVNAHADKTIDRLG